MIGTPLNRAESALKYYKSDGEIFTKDDMEAFLRAISQYTNAELLARGVKAKQIEIKIIAGEKTYSISNDVKISS